jgi:hypothetical protein
LEKNQDNIKWFAISTNPNIFEPHYKYNKLKERMKNTYVEELLKNRLHPSRIEKLLNMGLDIDDIF